MVGKSLSKKEFEEYFYKYYRPLVKYIIVIVKDKYIAEDIVQDLFSRLPCIYSLYKEEKGNFEQYLFKCAKNETYLYLRKVNKLKNMTCELNEELIADYSNYNQNEFNICELEEILSNEEIQYVYLEFCEGFSTKEIANILNINPTARKRYRKAVLNKIKKFLEKEGIKL